ncbi:MAG: OB-fold nucleic acid binding domain-containing protein, partial [Thermoproteota archaeon]|nr:OB-fold nucleic acid binding domain-containing protein [Thermoproteota archaeon]
MMEDIHRSHFTNDLNENLVGQKVKIAGWIEDIRDIGKLAFLIIRDSSGAAQAVVTGVNLNLARDIPRQSAV